MLVLKRKCGEEIRIGEGPDAIVVRVVRVDHHDTVQVGIEAPPQVRILRGELRQLPETVDTQRQSGLS